MSFCRANEREGKKEKAGRDATREESWMTSRMIKAIKREGKMKQGGCVQTTTSLGCHKENCVVAIEFPERAEIFICRRRANLCHPEEIKEMNKFFYHIYIEYFFVKQNMKNSCKIILKKYINLYNCMYYKRYIWMTQVLPLKILRAKTNINCTLYKNMKK